MATETAQDRLETEGLVAIVVNGIALAPRT
jgi:hypothetical protein